MLIQIISHWLFINYALMPNIGQYLSVFLASSSFVYFGSITSNKTIGVTINFILALLMAILLLIISHDNNDKINMIKSLIYLGGSIVSFIGTIINIKKVPK